MSGTQVEVSVTVPNNTVLQNSCSSPLAALSGANYTVSGVLPVLTNGFNYVGTNNGNAAAGDALGLPLAEPGLEILVFNASGVELALFATGTNDTINGLFSGSYVRLPPNSINLFYCAEQTVWASETIGSGFLGNFPTASGHDGISAAGTTQAGATPLTALYNRVTTVASGAGVSLPATSGLLLAGACLAVTVVNAQGTNALKVYPAGSEVIEGGSAGGAFSVAAATSGQGGKVATFFKLGGSSPWHVMLSSN